VRFLKKTEWLGRLAPWGFFVLKILVSVYSLHRYMPHYLRLTYIADGPARGIEAFNLAYGDFGVFKTYQFLPMQIWLWAGLLKLYPDVYWTGTALNVAFAAGTTVLLYLLGRELAGPAAGALAAVLFIFSPVHHCLTISEGMAESIFFFWNAAGIYAAARAAREGRGEWVAGLCFGAAALTRYESAALLILYSAYRLFRARPRSAGGWLLWVAPLAAVAAILGHKAMLAAHVGVRHDLAGVKGDSELVLPGALWYERVAYGLTRVWRDGRVFGLLGAAGFFLVWLRGIRNESRLLIWGGLATLLVGVSTVFAVVGLGLGPERHFSIILMFLFPFAGLTVVEAWRRARGLALKIVLIVLLAAAGAYTVYFDSAIKDYGYGFPGPCYCCMTVDAELALKLRDLWRSGELGPDEIIYMEQNDGNFSNYPIQAYSNRPRNFYVSPAYQSERDLWYLDYIMETNGFRVAIFVNAVSRHQLKSFYRALGKKYVIYETPAHSLVVRRDGWPRGLPDFRSARHPGQSRVIDYGSPGAVIKRTP
jgi:hypothetical protein